MKSFYLNTNKFLRKPTGGVYSLPYYGKGRPRNPDFLYNLKNNFIKTRPRSEHLLKKDKNKLMEVFREDLKKITKISKVNPLTVCVVPRAKAEGSYETNQLIFRETVGEILNEIPSLNNGIGFISRHTNTRTTHLKRREVGFVNDGDHPYPGIAKDTCHFDSRINGLDILLIDDIYTKPVNIAEDMVQSLYDSGAKSVLFYAVGYTVKKY